MQVQKSMKIIFQNRISSRNISEILTYEGKTALSINLRTLTIIIWRKCMNKQELKSEGNIVNHGSTAKHGNNFIFFRFFKRLMIY